MNVEVDVKLDKTTFNKINQFPNKFLYRVARQTLDMSYEYIPRLTGRLRSFFSSSVASTSFLHSGQRLLTSR